MAVIDSQVQRRITFGEFDERVRRAANGLRGALGLNQGERVAILARNCIEVLELILACARCGLIAQPLNWRLSTPELLRIVGDDEPRVMVASPEYAATAQALADSAALPHKLHTLTFSATAAPGNRCARRTPALARMSAAGA